MSGLDPHPALARVLQLDGAPAALRLLGSDLAGADATSLLLAAMARRTTELRPADVLAQYRRDRFVAPAAVDALRLARLRLQALEGLGRDFEIVEPAPLAPLGSHSVFSRVDQNNVVSTIRMSEVAADPTNQLALEAALRRQRQLAADPKSREEVRLCAVERVTRAQVFHDAASFAHFTLLGVVVGGRNRGGGRFESRALAVVLTALSGFVADVTGRPVSARVTDFDGSFEGVVREVVDEVSSDRVSCGVDADRQAGRGYYPNVCFKLSVDTGDDVLEVGDGGSVDWASSLLHNGKERLLIGAVSLERLALIES